MTIMHNPDEHESRFYEFLWRINGEGRVRPMPWWAQQELERWTDVYNSGLFPSRAAALASNALYRYWNMIGVKDHHQESLVGQAGEIEPVYDKYALSFFLFDVTAKTAHYPQYPPAPRAGTPSLSQQLEAGYLPIVLTEYRSPV